MKTELFDSSAFGESETVIQADLDYVCKYANFSLPSLQVRSAEPAYLNSVWSETNFDLWEEVNGKHHFNHLITIRALYDAYKFATRLGSTELATKYKETAEKIEKTALQQFWDEENGYLKVTVDAKNSGGKLRWLDTGKSHYSTT